MMEKRILGRVRLETGCGPVLGNRREDCLEFLGVPYARAERFAYASPVEHWEGELDAGSFGPSCPQNRAWHEHLEHPTRRFYKREFREGIDFHYSEDCLNLNIFTPKQAENCPVLLFIHGGGFDSGANCENPFDGAGFARRGIVTVFINYRVGVLGYLCHEQLQRRFGRDGNFGLDDQLTAIRWVRDHIRALGGDPENISLCGQSAGAISIQLMCLNPQNAGLFRRAVMLSGGGLFPKFARPRPLTDAREYWLQFLKTAGCESLQALKELDLDSLFDAVEAIKAQRKDSVHFTMPVIDGLLVPGPVEELMKKPLKLDYLLGYTNNDMVAPVMAFIERRFARQTGGYVYDFDLDAPGDGNAAFHSADLPYLFETLDRSWRPYGPRHREAARQLADYVANFARSGDPNGPGLPRWEPMGGRVLRFSDSRTAMGRTDYGKLVKNMMKIGDPKG